VRYFRTHPDYEAMLADSDIDAVDIPLPRPCRHRTILLGSPRAEATRVDPLAHWSTSNSDPPTMITDWMLCTMMPSHALW
jgi:hypothetical protein